MAKEDIKLRTTVSAPLTTKGSALTWAELDANWIEIYNAFVSLSQSSYVDAYDAAVEYDDTTLNYVSYDSQIWKMINVIPQTAVTPGTDPATWSKVYATDLVGREQLHSKKISLTANQINNGFSSEIEFISAKGAGTFIQPINCVLKMTYNGVAFDAATIYIKSNGADNNSGFFINGNINGAASLSNIIALNDGTISDNTSVVISFNVDGSSSPLGNGTIDLYLVYKITTL